MARTRQVNVHHAKTELSKLLLEVERGHEVVIARNGAPVARLVPFPATAARRLRVDTWRGQVRLADDFDAPLGGRDLEDWGG